MNKIIYVIAIILFISCNSKQKVEIPTAKVKLGTFTLEITEEGEIEATNSELIEAPSSYRYGMLKVTSLVEDGADVEKGDTVVAFDPSDVKKRITDVETKLEIHEAELEKMRAQHKSEIEDRTANLEIAKLDNQISRIRFESSDYEADIKKKEIKLNLDKSDIALEKAADEIVNRKKIQHEEIQQKLLWMSQSETDLEEAHEALNQMFVTTPSPGIAIIKENYTTDTKIQVGDQLWRDYDIVELPDLSELKAEVRVNEVDVAKIKIGDKVIVRLDAFSDSIYHGEIASIANLAVNKSRGSKIKVFPVDIIIQENSKALMPGLTVSCQIIIDEIEDVLSIPLEALHTEAGIDFVFVKNGTGFKKREVTIGLSNNDFVVIEKGIKEGNKVALIDPFIKDEEDASEDKN